MAHLRDPANCATPCPIMPTPTLREFLEQREQDLIQEIGELRGKLVPLEGELAEVRKTKLSLSQQLTTVSVTVGGPIEIVAAAEPRAVPSHYQSLTMKGLVLKALREHFHDGATANELIEFFANAWGRTDVVRSSLSPQLSRLKVEGKITLRGYKWLLVPLGKNEAPTGDQPEGASKAGEGDTSPIESRGVQQDIFG